ncbi:MAG: hypothetical protein EBU81_16090 [Proteobacteria bacterium]|nr:hypothetical protein [Pseudomonadota bacterium]
MSASVVAICTFSAPSWLSSDSARSPNAAIAGAAGRAGSGRWMPMSRSRAGGFAQWPKASNASVRMRSGSPASWAIVARRRAACGVPTRKLAFTILSSIADV